MRRRLAASLLTRSRMLSLRRLPLLARPDGSELRRLTAGGKETNWLDLWAHDGRALALASNRRTPATMDAYLVDVASGALRLVAENQGIGTIDDISRDGRWAVLNRMRRGKIVGRVVLTIG